MPGDIRPLRVGSLGNTRVISERTWSYKIKSGATKTRVATGTVTLEGRMDPGFQRLLRDTGRYTRAQGDANRTHASMAFGAVSRVWSDLDKKVKANPRPNREGREGLRETLRLRHEDLTSVQLANAANAGFTVDFNKLDEIGPRDDQGRPYWRFVDQGFSGGRVRGLFASDRGFSAPSGARRFMDPRMPNLPLGAVIEVSGFEGYDFVGPVLDRYARELRRTAYSTYLADLNWPDEVRAAAISFMAGGNESSLSGPDFREF